MDAQNTRGMCFILPGRVQHFVDIAVFQFLQGYELIAGRRNIERDSNSSSSGSS